MKLEKTAGLISVILWGVFALMLAAPDRALAHSFVFTDPKYDFTVSFPDTWKLQSPVTPETRWMAAAPVYADHAVCRMDAVEDGRLKIYPRHHLPTAVRRTLDRPFWEQQLASYGNVQILAHHGHGGLGRGDASFAIADYDQEGPGGMMRMRAMMLGSIYAGTRYVVICSARGEIFDRWRPVFASVIDSINFKEGYHIFPTGNYRNFLADLKQKGKPGWAIFKRE